MACLCALVLEQKFLLQGQACCDNVSAGLWKVSAASPTPHPPVNPLFLTLFLTFRPIGTQKLV